ncbi:hypothetical protein EDD22DRAFT_843729 [Suillus occidentalis]|nr:hypothetical protein EDD22DRAFT_843729 [Suillus occidentalis]
MGNPNDSNRLLIDWEFAIYVTPNDEYSIGGTGTIPFMSHVLLAQMAELQTKATQQEVHKSSSKTLVLLPSHISQSFGDDLKSLFYVYFFAVSMEEAHLGKQFHPYFTKLIPLVKERRVILRDNMEMRVTFDSVIGLLECHLATLQDDEEHFFTNENLRKSAEELTQHLKKWAAEVGWSTSISSPQSAKQKKHEASSSCHLKLAYPCITLQFTSFDLRIKHMQQKEEIWITIERDLSMMVVHQVENTVFWPPNTGTGGRNAQLEKIGILIEASSQAHQPKGSTSLDSTVPVNPQAPEPPCSKGQGCRPKVAPPLYSPSATTDANTTEPSQPFNPLICQAGRRFSLHPTVTKKVAWKPACQIATGPSVADSVAPPAGFLDQNIDPALHNIYLVEHQSLEANISSDDNSKDDDNDNDEEDDEETRFPGHEPPLQSQATHPLTPEFDFQYSHDENDMVAQTSVSHMANPSMPSNQLSNSSQCCAHSYLPFEAPPDASPTQLQLQEAQVMTFTARQCIEMPLQEEWPATSSQS